MFGTFACPSTIEQLGTPGDVPSWLSPHVLMPLSVCAQIHRVISRDWKLWHNNVASAWRRDGHDNNWLLLEFALSLPFAVGLKTEAVSRTLAATMIAEVHLYQRNWLAVVPNALYVSARCEPRFLRMKLSCSSADYLQTTMAEARGFSRTQALTCWPFWKTWPTWQYQLHVRSHFFTNFGTRARCW